MASLHTATMKSLRIQAAPLCKRSVCPAQVPAVLHQSAQPCVGRSQVIAQSGRRPKPPLITPSIVIGDPSSGQQMDPMRFLTQQRIIFIGDRITDQMSVQIVAQLLALESIDPAAEIRIYINSGGGLPYAINAILDTMDIIKCPITTIAMGCCMSQSTLLLAAGTPGRRYAMPSTRIMMHQPQGGAQGSTHEVEITTKELNRTMQVIQAMYARYTGQTLEKIEEETDRDTFLSPTDAKELGLIDGILV